VGVRDGREDFRRNRDPIAAVGERHNIGDAGGPVKHKHGILLILYRS
jgi:hypothetical protein